MADVFKSDVMKILASEAATIATRTGDDIFNQLASHDTLPARGVALRLNLSNLVGSTATYTLKIQIKMENEDYIDWWEVAAAQSTAADFLYVIYPANLGALADGITEIRKLPLPSLFRVILTPASANASNSLDTLVDANFLS